MPPDAPGPREIPPHGQEDGQTAPGGAGPQTCFMGVQLYSRASSRQSAQSSAPSFVPSNERTPRRGQWGKPPEVADLQGRGIGVQGGPWRGANVHGRPMASTVQSPIQAPREQFCLLVHQSPGSRVWGQGRGILTLWPEGTALGSCQMPERDSRLPPAPSLFPALLPWDTTGTFILSYPLFYLYACISPSHLVPQCTGRKLGSAVTNLKCH